MNNYYKPEIKEICSGFECEIKPRVRTGLMSWVEQNFTYCDFWEPIQVREKREGWDIIEKFNHPWSLDDFVSYLKDDAVRVKCLDRQDIDELGWSLYYEDLGFEFYELYDEISRWTIQTDFDLGAYIDFNMNYLYSIKRFIKDSGGKFCDSQMVYRGIIKNKSELKWIMEKTGIL